MRYPFWKSRRFLSLRIKIFDVYLCITLGIATIFVSSLRNVTTLALYHEGPTSCILAVFHVRPPPPELWYVSFAPVLFRMRKYLVLYGRLHIFMEFDGRCEVSLIKRNFRPRTNRRVFFLRDEYVLRFHPLNFKKFSRIWIAFEMSITVTFPLGQILVYIACPTPPYVRVSPEMFLHQRQQGWPPRQCQSAIDF